MRINLRMQCLISVQEVYLNILLEVKKVRRSFRLTFPQCSTWNIEREGYTPE